MSNGQQGQNPNLRLVGNSLTSNAGAESNNWGETPGHQPEAIGSNVNAAATIPFGEQLPSSETEPKLGEIVPVDMPPGYQETSNNPVEGVGTTDNAMPADITAEINKIHAGKEHIPPETLKMTENIINEVKKGEIPIDTFYDNVRGENGMAETYIKSMRGKVA